MGIAMLLAAGLELAGATPRPKPSADETAAKVVAYAKALDVQRLDKSLEHESLERYLGRILSHRMSIDWGVGCDLKVPRPTGPLCASVQGSCPRGFLKLLIEVGTEDEGIHGEPRLREASLWGPSSDPVHPVDTGWIERLGQLKDALERWERRR